jgi:hypothetical protein
MEDANGAVGEAVSPTNGKEEPSTFITRTFDGGSPTTTSHRLELSQQKKEPRLYHQQLLRFVMLFPRVPL